MNATKTSPIETPAAISEASDFSKSSAKKTGPQKTGQEGGIYQHILQAQKAISSIPKRGFNRYQQYHYATEADILSIKDILNENCLVVLPTTLHQETGFKPDGKSWASVTLLFRVIDATTGETVESQFTGYAEDSYDKAIYKATTGANKYFYLKFFGIPTEDDPERDEVPVGHHRGSSRLALKAAKENPAHPPVERSSPQKAVGLPSRAEALTAANKILALQKQAGLSNEEVLLYGEIDSIKGLAEAGDTAQLSQAYEKLMKQVQPMSLAQ